RLGQTQGFLPDLLQEGGGGLAEPLRPALQRLAPVAVLGLQRLDGLGMGFAFQGQPDGVAEALYGVALAVHRVDHRLVVILTSDGADGLPESGDLAGAMLEGSGHQAPYSPAMRMNGISASESYASRAAPLDDPPVSPACFPPS